MQDEAVERREKAREHAADKAGRAERAQRKEKSAGNKGSKTSKEMQARRDERKQIQNEYRESDPDDRPTGKKPWWKFWASDDA